MNLTAQMKTPKPAPNQSTRTLPKDWREMRLGDVAEIIMGQSPKSETYNENGEGLPFYQGIVDFGDKFTTSRVYCSSPKKIIEAGDILLSVRAPVGKVNFTKEKCSIGRGNAGLRMKNGLSNFLFYLLQFSENQFHRSSSGSVFSSINKSSIENLKIDLPPLPEQKVIAEVLSSLDDKIDLLHRQNKTLEDMAQTLFRKWFIDEADEDWEVGKIPDEFHFIMGQSPPGESYNEDQNGTPMFQGNADFSFRFPTNRIYTTQPKRLAEKYDILISVRAPVGEQNMAKEKCCIGRGVAAFRYKNDRSFYTYTYFKMMSLTKKIKQYNQTGTVFGSISKSDFQNMEVTIPPIELIKKFQEIAKPIDEKIISNQSQIYTLENLRDTLLPKLMSGKVRINV